MLYGAPCPWFVAWDRYKSTPSSQEPFYSRETRDSARSKRHASGRRNNALSLKSAFKNRTMTIRMNTSALRVAFSNDPECAAAHIFGQNPLFRSQFGDRDGFSVLAMHIDLGCYSICTIYSVLRRFTALFKTLPSFLTL